MKKKSMLLICSLVVAVVLSMTGVAFSTGEYTFELKPYDFTTKKDVTTETEEMGVLMFIKNNTQNLVQFDQIQTLDSSVQLFKLTGASVPLTNVQPTSGLIPIAPYGTASVNLDVITISTTIPVSGTIAIEQPSNYLLSMGVGMNIDGAPLLTQFSELVPVDTSYNVNWDAIRDLSNAGVNWTQLTNFLEAENDPGCETNWDCGGTNWTSSAVITFK